MNDILIGGYIETNSVIHRLNGKIKLLCFVLMLLYTLMFKGLASIAVNAVIIIAVILVSKVQAKNILSFLKGYGCFFL